MDAAPPSPGPPPQSRGRRRALPWLLWLLTLSVLAAVVGAALHQHADDRDDLAAARDEAADLRRRLLVAEDLLLAKAHPTAVAPIPSPSPRP